jgi:hypothetical protein
MEPNTIGGFGSSELNQPRPNCLAWPFVYNLQQMTKFDFEQLLARSRRAAAHLDGRAEVTHHIDGTDARDPILDTTLRPSRLKTIASDETIRNTVQ